MGGVLSLLRLDEPAAEEPAALEEEWAVEEPGALEEEWAAEEPV